MKAFFTGAAMLGLSVASAAAEDSFEYEGLINSYEFNGEGRPSDPVGYAALFKLSTDTDLVHIKFTCDNLTMLSLNVALNGIHDMVFEEYGYGIKQTSKISDGVISGVINAYFECMPQPIS